MNSKILLKDTTLKILSVVFAIILWFYVITEQNPVTVKSITEIPIELINMNYLDRNDFVLMSNIESFKLSVSANGKKSILDSMSKTSVKVTADMSGVNNEGINIIPINISGIPEGVTWKPSLSSIEVVVEPKISSQLAVQVDIMGEPYLGLASMMPIIDPADVLVSGPISIVNKVAYAKADIDVTGANSDISKNLSVRLFDKEGNEVTNVEFQPKRVNVQVPISNTKRLPIQFDLEDIPAVGYMVTNTYYYPKEVIVTGKQEVLENIEYLKTEKINLTNLTESLDKEIGLIMPLGLELVNKAESIRINVEIEEIITRSVSINDIGIRNLDKNYAHEPINETIYLSVRGPKNLVNNAKNIIKLYVDMRHAAEGDNSFDILWEKDMDLDILDVNPQSIHINLKKTDMQSAQ